MKFSYNEYNRIRNLYLSSNDIKEQNKYLNIIIQDKFEEYSKYIEYENRVRNILKLFFSKEIWGEFERLNLLPQDFYNNFLNKAKELNYKKNHLNFDSQLHYNPELKKEFEDLEHKLYIVTIDTVNKLNPLYENHYVQNKRI